MIEHLNVRLEYLENKIQMITNDGRAIDSSHRRERNLTRFLIRLATQSFTFRTMNVISMGWGSRMSPLRVPQTPSRCGLYVDIDEVDFHMLNAEFVAALGVDHADFTALWFFFRRARRPT